MKQKHLKQLLDMLKQASDSYQGDYFIPELWNSFGYTDYSKHAARAGEINVNPYRFLIACIEQQILTQADSNSNHGDRPSAPIEESVIYSMLVRMFSAWKHDSNQENLHSGTWLKTIALLPYLKAMHINVIYLLPVFEQSDVYKKGEIGSPYAIKNIYKLDPSLHDPLLGSCSEAIVELQFQAFIEACHLLGIKVVVDFVFRTAARDNHLILDHPDWFYWIDSEYGQTFALPPVETLPELAPLNDESFQQLYRSPKINEYLSSFAFAPSETDEEKWKSLLAAYSEGSGSILTRIEELYGITTCPAFSDVLNDPQPLWTDVTYLRFYLDFHEKVQPYLPDNQPPYILQDGAKLSLYSCRVKNSGLWEYVLNVIPYYQQKFGIDGARVDMAHALPQPLNEEMIARAKAINPDFIFWSEELDVERSLAAKENGFHMISGRTWEFYYGCKGASDYSAFVANTLIPSSLPMIGALETPDTPRAVMLHRNKKRIALLLFLSYWSPNVIPLISNGLELAEMLPMNMGFQAGDGSECSDFVVDEQDERQGKLAFFDPYYLRWTNEEHLWLLELMKQALGLRAAFIGVIANGSCHVDSSAADNEDAVYLIYQDPDDNSRLLFVIANWGKQAMELDVCADLNRVAGREVNTIHPFYQDGQLLGEAAPLKEAVSLQPFEVMIGYASYTNLNFAN